MEDMVRLEALYGTVHVQKADAVDEELGRKCQRSLFIKRDLETRLYGTPAGAAVHMVECGHGRDAGPGTFEC